MPPEMPTVARPAQATTEQLLDRVLQNTQHFDPEMYHVIDKRDDQLVRDEALQGVTSDTFVYEFSISGKTVSGISVRGAAHLAHLYGGIKHRLIASIDKRGGLFTFKTYPSSGGAMNVTVQRIPELTADDDYFEVVVEVEDVKNGNSIQCTKKQMAVGYSKEGPYPIQHHEILAESKAFRNAVLRIVSQDVVNDFKKRALGAKHGVDVTADTITEKRDGILKFAAKHAITVDREKVAGLVYVQIAGLAEAARQGIEQFKASAAALGLVAGEAGVSAGTPAAGDASNAPATSPPPPPAAESKQRGRPRKETAAPPAQDQRPEPTAGNGQGQIEMPMVTAPKPPPPPAAAPKPPAPAKEEPAAKGGDEDFLGGFR